jgi:phage terminase small subunit
MPGKDLSPKHQRFVGEYLVDLNGKQAAIRAGYSPKSAEVTASRLLSNTKVRKAINAAKERRADRVEVKSDDVLRELKLIAFCDVRQAYTPDGRLKPIHEIPEDVARAISLEAEDVLVPGTDERAQSSKLKFWSKPQALELLGKHLKLFTEKVEHSFSDMTDEQLEAKYREAVARVGAEGKST